MVAFDRLSLQRLPRPLLGRPRPHVGPCWLKARIRESAQCVDECPSIKTVSTGCILCTDAYEVIMAGPGERRQVKELVYRGRGGSTIGWEGCRTVVTLRGSSVVHPLGTRALWPNALASPRTTRDHAHPPPHLPAVRRLRHAGDLGGPRPTPSRDSNGGSPCQAASRMRRARRRPAVRAVDQALLKSLPFDKIKIDRSLLQDVGRSQKADAIIRAILRLTRTLGFQHG